jgi:hypothetical protein
MFYLFIISLIHIAEPYYMMPNTSNSQDSNPQVDDMWIPEGFVLVIGPNNQKYIMPEYCVPDLDSIVSKKKT